MSHDRTAKLIRQPDWARFPFIVRCYGSGVCTKSEGVPKHFMQLADAEAARDRWIDEGR